MLGETGFHRSGQLQQLETCFAETNSPIRDQFEEGDWVLCWRRKGGNLRRERGRWYGPARVIQVESRNVVWLVHANQLVRASPEQLRSASLRE
jgi:hypothetical protein